MMSLCFLLHLPGLPHPAGRVFLTGEKKYMEPLFNSHRATTQHSPGAAIPFKALAQADGEYFTEMKMEHDRRRSKERQR
ncbi:hypothetical protein [Kosakonia pseudosacchari]|uniref:hypothetical protein n=1 Tax=Kosakonia pseudosacchari TaxID=1646340 RepID=UPI000A3A1EFF|nr:hypothetical protein [Kosakonia pseudosacchari]QOV64911.1 hypothetical protein IP581_04400 [Kosakonia pseudosacchari]